MYAAVRLLDRLLSRIYHVYRYSDDPACGFRICVTRLPNDITLPGEHLAAGVPVIVLHMDNERMPPLPAAGPDLAWALRAQRMLVGSWRTLADYLLAHPELAQVRALGAVTWMGMMGPGSERLFDRLGFTTQPYHSPLGWFGEFWENVYTWWLMGAYNPASRHGRSLLGIRRVEAWMARETFLERFGEKRS